MKKAEDRQMRARKARDAALIIPLMGLLLLTPPLAQTFAIGETIAGVPIVVLYIFAIWAALIAIARLLAIRLSADEDAETQDE